MTNLLVSLGIVFLFGIAIWLDRYSNRIKIFTNHPEEIKIKRAGKRVLISFNEVSNSLFLSIINEGVFINIPVKNTTLKDVQDYVFSQTNDPLLKILFNYNGIYDEKDFNKIEVLLLHRCRDEIKNRILA